MPASGTQAFYDLSASSGMTTYELLDSAGLVVHRGSNPAAPLAIVANNGGGAPFMIDQVFLASDVNTITGLDVPEPLYSSPPSLLSFANLSFREYVGNGGPEYLTDLSIPTDAATYLAFPTFKTFSAGIEFGDGDYLDRVNPYQFVYTELQYDVDSLSVSAVPEPAAAGLLLATLSVLGLRRRARHGDRGLTGPSRPAVR